jgi:hypothetical protein
MYTSDLRHIHDPVLSSLKMEGIHFFLSFFFFFVALTISSNLLGGGVLVNMESL